MLGVLKRIFFNWHFFNLTFVILLAAVALRPLAHEGLYTAHDIWHQVARHYYYHSALTEGQFFPAWISNMAYGYGYPLFIFSYHWPWLLGFIFTSLGLSIFGSIKTIFAFSFFLSGISMYIFTAYYFKSKTAGLLSALLYLWAPYQFLTLYVSTAIGTATVFSLLPLVFLGAILLAKKPRLGIGLLSFSLAGIFLSHVITFALVVPFVSCWLIGKWLIEYFGQHRFNLFQRLAYVGAGLILGLGLVSFYLLPLVKYLPLIQATTNTAGFSQVYLGNFVYLKQLLYSPWGFGPIISNAKDGEISFQIGLAHWLSVIIALVVACWYGYQALQFKKKTAGLYLAHLVLLLIIFALVIFFMLDYSQPFWKFGSTLIGLDYPFRLLLLAVFFGSLVAGWLMKVVTVPLLKYPLFLGLLMVALYTNRNHVRVNQYTDVPLDLYVRSEKTTNTFHEYLPSRADTSLLDEENSPLVLPSTAIAQVNYQNTRELALTVELAQPSQVSLHQYDFPGQTVTVNGNLVSHMSDNLGLISLPLESGRYQVIVRYEKPAIFKLGLMISGLTLLVTIFLVSGIKIRKFL